MLGDAESILDEVQTSQNMMSLWKSYQKKFDYATDIGWNEVMEAVRRLYRICRINED